VQPDILVARYCICIEIKTVSLTAHAELPRLLGPALDCAPYRRRLISCRQERQTDASSGPDQPCAVADGCDVARYFIEFVLLIAE
jgi:hypothetical protein